MAKLELLQIHEILQKNWIFSGSFYFILWFRKGFPCFVWCKSRSSQLGGTLQCIQFGLLWFRNWSWMIGHSCGSFWQCSIWLGLVFSLVHNYRQMRKRPKEPTLKWFSCFLWCFDINGRRSGRFDTLNIFWSPYIARMRHNFGATGAQESPK